VNAFALVRAAREVMPAALESRPAVAAWLGRVGVRAGDLGDIAYAAPT
jgi:hypothetical protein